MEQNINNQDSAWKDIIEGLFNDFIAFFFPVVHSEIDWKKGFTFLSNELRKIIKDNQINKKFVDELVKVYLKDGTEKWILIHFEIQGYKEDKFSERLFIYNYRIFDKYHHKVITLVILTDKDENYRPESYSVSKWGFELKMKTPIVKIIDYKDKVEELEKHKNPMALVVLSLLESFKAEKKDIKFNIKLNLIRKLYSKGYNKDRVNLIFKFIDWILNLPEQDELKIIDEIHKLEGNNMPYVTTIERIAKREGKKEGKKEGAIKKAAEVVLNMYSYGLSIDNISKYTNISINKIEEIIKKATTNNR